MHIIQFHLHESITTWRLKPPQWCNLLLHIIYIAHNFVYYNLYYCILCNYILFIANFFTYYITTYSLCIYILCVYMHIYVYILSSSVASDSLRPHGLYLPGSSVHGIFQARTLDWVATSPFRGSSWSKDWIQFSCVSCISSQILYHCATWEALYIHGVCVCI